MKVEEALDRLVRYGLRKEKGFRSSHNAVLLRLLQFSNDMPSGYSMSVISLNELSMSCNMDVSTVRRALRDLEEKGLIEIVHQQGRDNSPLSNAYYFQMDFVEDVLGGMKSKWTGMTC